MADPVAVSVVVLHRNGYPMLRDCLLSVMRHTTGVSHEIIVVDNASTDDSLARLEADFPGVRVVKSAENLGFARGNNLGSRSASGKYLFFLNNDTKLFNDAVGMFHRFAVDHAADRWGALGGFLENGKNGIEHSFGKFPGPFFQFAVILENLGILHGERAYIQAALQSHKRWFSVDFMTGAALFVPREVFVELGGFDEDFFLYFEETELQHRMAEAGYLRYLIKGPRIIHYGGGGAPRSNWRRMETYRGMFLYYRKTQGRRNLLVFRFLSPFFIIGHLFHPAFKFRENLDFLRFCFSELWQRAW